MALPFREAGAPVFVIAFLEAFPVWFVWLVSYMAGRFCWEFVLLVVAHLAVITITTSSLAAWFSP